MRGAHVQRHFRLQRGAPNPRRWRIQIRLLHGGVSSNCSLVSNLDESVGTAVLEGSTLVLYPTQRRVRYEDCTTSTSKDLGTEPISFGVSLSDTRYFYGGLRTCDMDLVGDAFPFAPFDLSLLFQGPVGTPEQPEQSVDFTLSEGGGLAELQGLWVPAEGTDSNFFNATTGEYYFPELNGSSHQWIRFGGDAYEAATALQNVNSQGHCRLDLIYYEQGSLRFAVLDDVNGEHNHFVGDTRLQASAAIPIARIRECDVDDGDFVYELTPTTSYYRWIYFSPDKPPESVSLGCQYPQSEWQRLLCDNHEYQTYRRRE